MKPDPAQPPGETPAPLERRLGPGGLACLACLALLAFAASAAAADAGKLANTLRWSTASEDDNYGFDVFRGDREEGPFTRLTDEPVPGAGDSDVPQLYEYVDDSIEPGRAYWYYVESISIHGDRERFTPVFRAPPKPTPPDESKDESEKEGGDEGAGEGGGGAGEERAADGGTDGGGGA